MSKFKKLTSPLKRFKKSNLGAYGVATTILSAPLFVITQYTLSNTEDLKNQTKLERAFDVAAETITIEGSKYRLKTNGSECKAVLSQTSYEKFSKLSPQCQYYLYIADIEKRTGVNNLLDAEKRNKVITEAIVRIFNPIAKDNELYPKNTAELLTKNVKNVCDLENIKDTTQKAIVCYVYGDAKTEKLFANNNFRSRSFTRADENGYSFRSASARSVKPLILNPSKSIDIIVAVDISAPFIPTIQPLLNDNQAGEQRFRVDDITDQYTETKANLKTISDFLGRVEHALFDKNKNNQVRLSYLAFSGGGQQFPQDYKNRMNVLPYVVRGETPATRNSNEDLNFTFANNALLQALYFPFLKGGDSFTEHSRQCSQTYNNNSIIGCTFTADPRTLQTQNDFYAKSQNTSFGYHPGINKTESILLQYLKTRFIQINSTFDSDYVGNKGICADPEYNPQGYYVENLNRERKSYSYGITCSGLETKTTDGDPKVGVSPVFAGILYDFVDIHKTIAKIKQFNGKPQDYQLKRLAVTADTIIPMPPANDNSTYANQVLNSTGSRDYGEVFYKDRPNVFVVDNKNNAIIATDTRNYPNLFNLTPTRNTSDRTYAFNYLNGRGVELVSGIRTAKGYYSPNYTTAQTTVLMDNFAKIKPSGIQYSSSGLILATNRLLSYDLPVQNSLNQTGNNQNIEKVIILVTNNRGEKQSALIDKRLVEAGMCTVIRETLKKHQANQTAKIFVVDIYPKNHGATETVVQKIHAQTWQNCANENYKTISDKANTAISNGYYIKTTQKELSTKLDDLINKIIK